MVLGSWTKQQEILKAHWLIGTWENKTSRGSIYETWEKQNETTFYGKSYTLREEDTVVFENIQLVQKQEGLFYIPVVKNQNQGLPVSFTLRTISEHEMIFENPKHDFPQRISYTRIAADSLVAVISGTRNGQERFQRFPMRRVK
jgi:hypothetical protein